MENEKVNTYIWHVNTISLMRVTNHQD